MVDGGLLGQIFSVFTIPAAVWTTVCAFIVYLYKIRVGEKNGDWVRLRDEIARLDERCDHLQKEVDECREREGEWMRRAIAAEAASEGIGEARQEAQRIVSTERQKPSDGGG